LLGKVKLCNKTLSTSGTYENAFSIQGQIYHHLIDPLTGFPADTDLLSVTVISPEGAFSEAYSTALNIMGSSAAYEFWSQQPNYDMILVTQDQQIILTPGLYDNFELLDPSYNVRMATKTHAPYDPK
jgi:thiamine biosynthesis lipoprotein